MSFMQLMVSNYKEIVDTKKDPLVDSWLLMGSPIPLLCILVFYLYFVLKLGPQLMTNRPPFKIKRIMIAYNAYQVLFSIWFCSLPLEIDNPGMVLYHGCHQSSVRTTSLSREISRGAWWYFFSKVVELLDTVFFVLRKKQNQVTFLHVYHHTITAFFSWCYLKYLPGEQGAPIGIINVFVHIIMYSYYLLAALGPKYQKYLWWKKYMTWLQLVQFCVMLSYLSMLLYFDCKVPKALTFFFVGNIAIFLFLFLKFYHGAYNKNKMKSI